MKAYIPTEEEYMEAIDIWLKENSNKKINDIKNAVIVKISNGHIISLGNKLSNVRRGIHPFSESTMEKLKNQYDFVQEKKLNKTTDKEYYEAIIKYIKDNNIESVYDIPKDAEILLDNGIIVNNIGRKIIDMSRGDRLLSEDYMKLLIQKTNFVIHKVKKFPTFDEYKEGLDIYLSKEENKDKTINTIPQKTIVEISNGSFIDIGTKIGEMRNGNYLFPKDKMDILIKDYGFKTSSELKDEESKIWINVIREWLKLNLGKNVNDIVNEEPNIIYDGIEYNIGSKFKRMRKGEALLEPKYMDILINEFGFMTSKERRKDKNERWLNAIKKYLELNSNRTINDTPKEGFPVEIDGEKYNVCPKLYNMRKHKDLLDEEYMNILITNYGFRFNDKTSEVKPRTQVITYEKYLDEFNDNVEKAKEKYNKVKKYKKILKEKRRIRKREELSLDEVLKHFNIDMEKLDKLLNRVSERESTSSTIQYDEDETFKSYCIRNGYNYSVIYYLYTHTTGRDIDSLIEQYRKQGQKNPINYIYRDESGNTLFKHMMLYIGLDSKNIIRDMERYNYTLPEAIRNDVFKKYMPREEDKWLEEFYDCLVDEVEENKTKDQIITDLTNVIITFKTDLKELITDEECSKVIDTWYKYISTMTRYNKLIVGLEKDRIKRKQLIKNYNLDEEEITEATLMGLDFINGIKRTDKSVESKRLEILKPLIIDWNKFDDKQKEKMIKGYNLSQEEIDKIIEYNNKLVFNLRID